MSKSEKDSDLPTNRIIQAGEIKFDYIKSNLFRVLHIDGAWGGITPKMDIWMAVFNERGAIPKQIVQRVKEDGRIGEEILEKRLSRDAIVREVEADLVMNLATAKSIAAWLQDKINKVEQALQAQKEKGKV